jgi:biopolymer transport protein ExbD
MRRRGSLRFKRSVQFEQDMRTIGIAPLLNIFFLLLIFFALSSVLTSPATIGVQLPKAMTGDVIREENVVIAITGENVIYMDNKIVAIKDLKARMSGLGKNVSVLIKADRRASVGRIVDVWNLCRGLGLERVNIATNQEQ